MVILVVFIVLMSECMLKVKQIKKIGEIKINENSILIF